MEAIAQGLQFILGKIVAALGWFGKLFVAVFVAAWDMLRDVFCWVFEQIMQLVVSALSALDFTGLTSQAGAWAGLPSQVLAVLAAVGLTTAVGLIVTAIGIRLMLQLIPFTRLGS